MATTTAAPSTYKQPSRKGKKAWRKNVDVTEISSGLDNVREELIQGGVISEKPSADLFVLDTTGSAEIKQKHLPNAKPLKADEIIAARASAIAGLDGRKRKANETDDKATKRRKNTYIAHAEVQRLKALADATSGASEVESSSASFDPWATEVKVQDPRFSYLKEKQPKVEPSTIKHKPLSLAATGKAFAAVKRPGAEKSYNPAFEAWQEAVDKAGAKEVEAERKRLREAADEAEREAKALAEAARPERPDGVDSEYESAWESEWEGIKSGAEDDDSTLNKKRPERKTPVERNKIKRRKVAESLATHEKNMALREDQQGRIKQIAKEVRQQEAARRAKQHQLAVVGDSSEESDGEDEVLRRRRYGKNALPETPLELVLADELQDSLRALRPEGNLLKDRFRNLLVNGKIEARKAITQPKKPKRTITEKWSYKDWKLRA